MSSYIIAGSSDKPEMAYCQEVANKIKAKYSNIDFRIIIKHPSQWENHIQQVCRIYGFKDKCNPIIYTFDGKMIGDKSAFIRNCRQYFGITQNQMKIGLVSTVVNEKIAEQQLSKKLKLQRGQKTMVQIIDQKFSQKLKNKLLTYKLAHYNKYIENGLIFYQRQVDGMISSMKFEVQKKKQVVLQQVVADEIDLAALTQNDQIPIVEQPKSNSHSQKQKDPFLTHQQDDKRSRTNGSQRLQDSMHSKSHISQQCLKRQSIKDKSNSIKPQATQPVLPDYDLINIQDYIALELGDSMYLTFDKKPIALGGLKAIKSAPSEQGIFQMDYVKKPRKVFGHLYDDRPRLPINQRLEQKQDDAISNHEQQQNHQLKLQTPQVVNLQSTQNPVVKVQDKIETAHQQVVIPLTQQNSQQTPKQQQPPVKILLLEQKKQEGAQQKDLIIPATTQFQTKKVQINDQLEIRKVQQNVENINHSSKVELGDSQIEFKNKKLRTQVDAKQFQEKKKKTRKGSMLPPEKYSINILNQLEHSEVDFAEHGAEQIDENAINLLTPWSLEQIQKIYDVVVGTKSIATIQMKPHKPNPSTNVFLRKHLNAATSNITTQSPLPIQDIILQQLNQLQPIQNGSSIGFIRKLMYAHVVTRVFSYDLIIDLCRKMISFLFKLQLKYSKFIGYNIILAPQYLMIVPLLNSYQTYNQQNLYLDGLASIGIVHIPKLISPFSIKKQQLKSPFEYIKICSGEIQLIENLIQN